MGKTTSKPQALIGFTTSQSSGRSWTKFRVAAEDRREICVGVYVRTHVCGCVFFFFSVEGKRSREISCRSNEPRRFSSIRFSFFDNRRFIPSFEISQIFTSYFFEKIKTLQLIIIFFKRILDRYSRIVKK